MFIKMVYEKVNYSFLLVYVGITSFLLFAPQNSFAQEANKIEDLVPIDVDMKDGESTVNFFVWILQLLAIGLGLFLLIAFVGTILSAMKDNNDDSTGRKSNVWSRIGTAFVLLVLGGAIAVLIFYGAPLLKTVKQ